MKCRCAHSRLVSSAQAPDSAPSALPAPTAAAPLPPQGETRARGRTRAAAIPWIHLGVPERPCGVRDILDSAARGRAQVAFPFRGDLDNGSYMEIMWCIKGT